MDNINDVLTDLFELIFQFALKSTFFELEISVLDKNGIEFYQKLIGICIRIVMMGK